MINTSTLQAMIANRGDQIAVLFKRYKIKKAPGVEGIMDGYNKFGQRFVLDLYQILQQTPTAQGANGFMIQQPNLAPAGEATGSSGSSTNVWGFLTELINSASSAWNTYKGNKPDNNLVQPYTPPATSGAIDTTKMITYGLGLAVVILLFILLFKKK